MRGLKTRCRKDGGRGLKPSLGWDGKLDGAGHPLECGSYPLGSPSEDGPPSRVRVRVKVRVRVRFRVTGRVTVTVMLV